MILYLSRISDNHLSSPAAHASTCAKMNGIEVVWLNAAVQM